MSRTKVSIPLNQSTIPTHTDLTPPSTTPEPADESSGKDHARKTCFAILGGNLGSRMLDNGLTPNDFWFTIKSFYDVESRSDLSEKQFTLIAARLSAAQKSDDLFDVLCGSIRSALGKASVRVYVDDKKIYEGAFDANIEARCQEYADRTGMAVRLHGTNGADSVKWIEPTADKPKAIPEIPDHKIPVFAYEIHRPKENEQHYINVPFPADSDVEGIKKWGQNHADDSGYEVHITNSDRVVLMKFEPTEKMAYCESCSSEFDDSQMHDDDTCSFCHTYKSIDDDMVSLDKSLNKHRDQSSDQNFLTSAEMYLAQIQKSVDILKGLE